MKIIISVILIGLSISLMGQNKLIYVGDPMCSWCYGFGPELTEVVETHEGQLEVELVMGGLRPYNKETMTDLKSFLTHHWEDVHKASGQPFSYGILDETELAYDTEPPCRASVVVRALAPEKELAFFKSAQTAFYKDNKDMNKSTSYHAMLKALELDTAAFDKLFDSNEYKTKVKKDFERAKLLGVSSFPTLLVEIDGKVTKVARGYAKAAEVNKNLEQLLSK